MTNPQPYQPVEVTSQLKKSGSVTLTATGGVIIFDPDHANQRWVVDSVVVSTNQAATATVVPVATVALNTPIPTLLSQGNNRGQSWSGNQDTFTGSIDVSAGDSLCVLFTPPQGQSGSTLVGVIANAVVTGTKYTRRG